jgi:nitrile hydratase
MTFRPGQRVRVSDRPHIGHHRTPGYVKGKIGTIDRVHASFTNPEARAYGSDGLPEQRLYLVGFAQIELWPDYPSGNRDRLCADIFEHWLEAAE